MARRRRMTRGRRVTKNRGWVATLRDDTQPANTFTATPILVPADYNRGNVDTTVRLETIYLELAAGPALAAGGAVNWAVFGIVAIDTDTVAGNATNDPDNADNLADERWLWTARAIIPATADGNLRWAVHVKQRVVLKDKDVRFVVSNSDPAEAFDYAFHSRVLVAFS